jgi:hypothetical protein
MAEPFAKVFAVFRPMERLWARWAQEGRTRGVAEGDDRKPQTIALGNWEIEVSFRQWQFGNDVQPPPPGTETPNGGMAVAQLGDNEFLVVGERARVKFNPAGSLAGKPSMYARVEEGHFDAAGRWVMERNWNGDQTDHGLNLTAHPVVLKVRLGTY